MQPLRAHQLAHEVEEYPAMNESTTGIDIVRLPTGQDVLTEVLRDGARRMLAQAIEAEVAAWIEAHAHLKDEEGEKGFGEKRGPARMALSPLSIGGLGT